MQKGGHAGCYSYKMSVIAEVSITDGSSENLIIIRPFWIGLPLILHRVGYRIRMRKVSAWKACFSGFKLSNGLTEFAYRLTELLTEWLQNFSGKYCQPAGCYVSTSVLSETPGQKTERTPIRQEDMKMKTNELKLNEMDKVNGGKIRYKEIEKYLTEEDKKELEELEKRIANS